MPEQEKVWRDDTSDSSEDDNTDDAVKPGCYVLDLENDFFNFTRIWVRAKYIQIYEFLVNFYEQSIMYGNLKPAAVITGQPGIGKTIWLSYALRRCLAEKRPVIWHDHNDYYMFVEEGVYLMGEHIRWPSYKIVVWMLVDSDEARDGVPEVLFA